MSILMASEEMIWLMDFLLRATLLLLLVFSAFRLLRRRSAAMRHHIGLIGFGSLLALPGIMAILPAELAVLPSLSGWFSQPRSGAVGAASGGLSLAWLLGIAGVWAGGAFTVLCRALAALQSFRGYERRASEAEDLEQALEEASGKLGSRPFAPGGLDRARVRMSREVDVPVTFGLLEPKILFPEEARSWSQQRIEMVLLHELAHIRRLDLLSQTFSLLVCGVFWFHPFAWALSRRLDLERERACDDLVLEHRGDALDYARQLVAIAEGLRGRPVTAFGVSMARPSQLGTRLRALLDSQVDRRAPGPVQAMLAVFLCLGLLLPLSAIPRTVQVEGRAPGSEPLPLEERETFRERSPESRGGHRGGASSWEGDGEEMGQPSSHGGHGSLGHEGGGHGATEHQSGGRGEEGGSRGGHSGSPSGHGTPAGHRGSSSHGSHRSPEGVGHRGGPEPGGGRTSTGSVGAGEPSR